MSLGFAGNYVVIPPYRDAVEPELACEVGGGDIRVETGGGTLHLRLNPHTSLLGQAYADSPRTYPFFEPTEVDGFPAVRRSFYEDWMGGMCEVVVATGPSQGLKVQHSPSASAGHGVKGNCDRLMPIVAEVMTRLGA
ncbi:hypothetical protein EV192_116124 [Actinocrispum wychmicini]|uniref:Uncharacterized protein n=1 Tax=Actinocrispum wychmicini TaxID=1213861 RepID=A0A4R2IRM7_9PSEU|nr:hypothetical protein EV192_116124 [Actinocrispum wychmicini]